MNILLLIGLAKANDHFRKTWLFAAVYAAINLFLKLLMPSTAATFGSIFLSTGFAFVAVGLLLSLLLRFEDSIAMWLATLAAGLFVLAGGAKLFLGVWFPL
ncbi:hypothetical protein [Propionivibrio limicola]|uniref:hypothetical protein n=1 Tax=Propionivibrio limicola TaxID=167645 RepID=UPI001291680A|nr:hypothetical protein [Propionivibrio limicola]